MKVYCENCKYVYDRLGSASQGCDKVLEDTFIDTPIRKERFTKRIEWCDYNSLNDCKYWEKGHVLSRVCKFGVNLFKIGVNLFEI